MEIKNDHLLAGKDRIIVQLMKTKVDNNLGGIIIPTEESTKLSKGLVTSVGRSDDNSIHEYEVVFFQKHNAIAYDEDTYILRQADVLAKTFEFDFDDEDEDE